MIRRNPHIGWNIPVIQGFAGKSISTVIRSEVAPLNTNAPRDSSAPLDSNSSFDSTESETLELLRSQLVNGKEQRQSQACDRTRFRENQQRKLRFDFDHGRIGQSIIFSVLRSFDSLRANKQLVCSRPISSASIVLSIIP